MLRRSFYSLLKIADPVFTPATPCLASLSLSRVLLHSGKRVVSTNIASIRSFSAIPKPTTKKRLIQSWTTVLKGPQWNWPGGTLATLPTAIWSGGLKSIAWRFRSQALESYCIWYGPLLKSLRGSFWPAERWLLVTGLLRNSRSWVPSFTLGMMHPERWLGVAMMSSLNTVGAQIPKMSLLLLAQVLARAGNAEAVCRDAYLPLASIRRPAAIHAKEAASTLVGMIWQEVCIWIRLWSLLCCFVPLFLTYPLTSINQAFWHMWLRSLRSTLETCGPAFIKWGQWASTRRDLFPQNVTKELRKLQTESPAHSAKKSKASLEAAFGLPVDALFSKFEEKPIASGSIGQVHRAKLSAVGATVTGVEEDTEVAVKIRHPDVDRAFQRDMNLMLWIAQCIDRFPILKGFNLHETIGQFAVPMAEQVDLRIEAANLQCFRTNFRTNHRVVFPEPLFPLVTSDILVETFHDGTCVQDLVDDVQSKETVLAELGSETFFNMVVCHNLLHADLHPGNILVKYAHPQTHFTDMLERLFDKTSKFIQSDTWNPFAQILKKWRTGKVLSPQIILLDGGMATQLSEKERYHMLGLFRSVAEMNGKLAAEHTLSFAGTTQSCPDPQGFRQDMVDHFNRVNRPDWTEAEFEASIDAFGHVIDIIRTHQVVLPGQIVSCLFTVFLLEGWSSKLDPDHSIMEQIKRMLNKLDWNFEQQFKNRANQVIIRGISSLSLMASVE